MELNREILLRLGKGESIDEICAAAQWTRAEFASWWQQQCQQRVPMDRGSAIIDGLTGPVRITRDSRGMPHVSAQNDRDLFAGFGYATAQDRLFQLDYGRRKARGRLAEILGREAVDSDILYRTLDLARIAAAEWDSLAASTRELLEAYVAGVNASMRAGRGRLPI
jgi:penicillin amidase